MSRIVGARRECDRYSRQGGAVIRPQQDNEGKYDLVKLGRAGQGGRERGMEAVKEGR